MGNNNKKNSTVILLLFLNGMMNDKRSNKSVYSTASEYKQRI